MHGLLKACWATAIALLLCCSQTAAQPMTERIGNPDAKDADLHITVEKQVRHTSAYA